MLGFIYKDIRTNRTHIAVILLVLAFFNILFPIAFLINGDDNGIESSGLFVTGAFAMMIFCSFLIVGAFAMNFVQTDERKKWGFYVVSLPSGKRNQVVAKYIFVAGMFGLTFCIVIVTNLIFKAISSMAPDILSITVVLLGIELIMKAIEMPCIIAFGSKIGTQVKGGLMALILVAAAIYAMFGDLSWIGSEESFWESIFKFISDFKFSRFGIILLLIGIPAYIISCLISTRLYIKGIDRMEK